MTATEAEPRAIELLREVIQGDDEQMLRAMKAGEALLAELSRPDEPNDLLAVAEAVAEVFGLTLVKLRENTRRREISHVRMVGMAVARELTGHALTRIGQFFGRPEHGTVLHAIRTVQARASVEPVFARRLALVRESASRRMSKEAAS